MLGGFGSGRDNGIGLENESSWAGIGRFKPTLTFLSLEPIFPLKQKACLCLYIPSISPQHYFTQAEPSTFILQCKPIATMVVYLHSAMQAHCKPWSSTFTLQGKPCPSTSRVCWLKKKMNFRPLLFHLQLHFFINSSKHFNRLT